MTRAALAALIIATTAVAAGGGDDHSSDLRVVRPVDGGVRGPVEAANLYLPFAVHRGGDYSLRIPFLARDGVAEPEPVATPVATPEPTVVVVEPPVLTIPEIICSPEFTWPCDEALSVAWCESRYRPWEVNDVSGTLGLFQMNPSYHTWRFFGGDWADPWVNTRAAYSLWLEDWWNQWTCSPYGWHP